MNVDNAVKVNCPKCGSDPGYSCLTRNQRSCRPHKVREQMFRTSTNQPTTSIDNIKP